MKEEDMVKKFHIPVFTWESINSDTKSAICSILNLDDSKSHYFFDLYFSKFHLLHKVGHIINCLFDEDHQEKSGRTEFCANLFAYKYLLEKKETEYLNTLVSVFDFLIKKSNIDPVLPKHRIDDYFSKMQNNIIEYLLVHGQIFLECITNTMPLPDVLSCISRHKLNAVNHGVILRKNLTGMDLVQESLAYVFEMNQVKVEVDFVQKEQLDKGNLELKLIEEIL